MARLCPLMVSFDLFSLQLKVIMLRQPRRAALSSGSNWVSRPSVPGV
jgi:hypothetical protein